MKSTVLTSAFLLLSIQLVSIASEESDLFLTPLIKSGNLDKARAQAEDTTKLIRVGKDIKSYSGFLTVDEKTNSNLFFWFFPSQQNPETAPVILWISDMPGFSSLKGLFLETGPFAITENNTLQERKTTWTKTHSVLYLDIPGTGFGFTNTENQYVNASDSEATEICKALKQFFTLFKDFQARDFYLVGETFAATLIPYIAKHIDNENTKGDFKINLKGIILGSPQVDAEQYLYRGQLMYNLGLFTKEQMEAHDAVLKKGIAMNKAGEDGSKIAWTTVAGPDSLFNRFAGFKDYRNALQPNNVAEDALYQKFIDSKEIHNYLHVGLHKFVGANYALLTHFLKDFAGDHEDILKEILDKGYRMLLYSAQFDLQVPAITVDRIVHRLKWKGAENFSKAERKVWRVNDDVAGYVKMADNLAYAMVRNAGNYAIRDQPEWTLDLIERFLYNKEF